MIETRATIKQNKKMQIIFCASDQVRHLRWESHISRNYVLDWLSLIFQRIFSASLLLWLTTIPSWFIKVLMRQFTRKKLSHVVILGRLVRNVRHVVNNFIRSIASDVNALTASSGGQLHISLSPSLSLSSCHYHTLSLEHTILISLTITHYYYLYPSLYLYFNIFLSLPHTITHFRCSLPHLSISFYYFLNITQILLFSLSLSLSLLYLTIFLSLPHTITHLYCPLLFYPFLPHTLAPISLSLMYLYR